MKRFLLIFVLMTGFIAEAGAVLKEKDLEQTLAILQSELEQYNNELTMRSAVRRERAKQLITNLQCREKGKGQAADHQPAADHEAGRPERADALFAGTDPPV